LIAMTFSAGWLDDRTPWIPRRPDIAHPAGPLHGGLYDGLRLIIEP